MDTEVILVYRVWLNDSEFNLSKNALTDLLNKDIQKNTPLIHDNINSNSNSNSNNYLNENSLLNKINMDNIGLSFLKNIPMNNYGDIISFTELNKYCLNGQFPLSNLNKSDRTFYKYVDNLNNIYVLGVKHTVNNNGYLVNDIMLFDITNQDFVDNNISESPNSIKKSVTGELNTNSNNINNINNNNGNKIHALPCDSGTKSTSINNIGIKFTDISSIPEKDIKNNISFEESTELPGLNNFIRQYEDYKLVFINGKVDHVELMYNFPNMHVDSLTLVRNTNIGGLDFETYGENGNGRGKQIVFAGG